MTFQGTSQCFLSEIIKKLALSECHGFQLSHNFEERQTGLPLLVMAPTIKVMVSATGFTGSQCQNQSQSLGRTQRAGQKCWRFCFQAPLDHQLLGGCNPPSFLCATKILSLCRICVEHNYLYYLFFNFFHFSQASVQYMWFSGRLSIIL